MMARLQVSAVWFFALLLVSACPQRASKDRASGGTSAGRKPQVVCTIGQLTDAAKQVGGEHVEVYGMMGAGSDPHQYQARPSDLTRMTAADLILYNGLHLEAKLADVLERMQGRVKTIQATESIPEELLLSPDGFAGAHDPHVWFDVGRWCYVVERVRDALIELDPSQATDYQDRAAGYLNELQELDDYIRSQVELVEPSQRVLVTAHDAFGYFADAYGFEVVGLQGISTATEAGTADVQELVEFVVERRIPAIFIESSVPERNIAAVQEAVRAQGWDVQIGGELFSDAVGDVGTPEESYIGMVRHNSDTIVAALATKERKE